MIYDLKHGKVIEMLENREKNTIIAWFNGQPKNWLNGICRVAIDMWRPYELAIREVFKDKVEIVVDKFHVVKQLNEQIQKCRREIQRRSQTQIKEKLKGIRWAIVKNPNRLTKQEKKDLRQALDNSPELRQMYTLKKEFLRIYRKQKRGGAIRQLLAWRKKVMATTLIHLHNFVKTLDNWWKEICAYFCSGLTNAGSEGLNTVIKLVHRRGFGFRNHKHFRIRVLHETGALSA